MKVTMSDIDHIKDRTREMESAYLRERGWEWTSDTPGSYWLWKKEIDGKVFLVQTGMAITLQHNADSMRAFSKRHEFMDDGTCVRCHIFYHEFERGDFQASCTEHEQDDPE